VTQAQLHALRDRILDTLRVQFATKVGVVLDAHLRRIDVDPLLRDLANNLAQGFAGEPTYQNIEGCALSDHLVEE
jgi:hypothetical protein